jgi:hypothetical protein
LISARSLASSGPENVGGDAVSAGIGCWAGG